MSASKIKQLRADNIALMTAATTCVQHARGTRFSLKTLYDLARSEEKEARCLVDKEFAHDSMLADAKDAAMTMSSITEDSDGYTTVSRPWQIPNYIPSQASSPTRRQGRQQEESF